MEQWVSFPWVQTFLICVFLIGALSGLVLLISKSPSGRWLGALLITYLFGIFIQATSWHFLLPAAVSLIVITCYLYIHAFFYQKTRTASVHFLIVIVSFTSNFIFDEIEWIYKPIGSIVILIYAGLILRLLYRESRSRGFSYFLNPGSRVSWLRNFVIFNGVFIASFAIGGDQLVSAVLFLLLLAFILHQLLKESSFLSPIPIGDKYQKSTLTPQIKAAVLDKIEGVMEQEFYLRDDASLTTLANELRVTTHHLSQVLNESLKIGFQDLIARYRIRRACQLLRDEQHRDVKIENIAAMVGYNSKSSFNAAFKKRTGLTPSDYRDKKDVRSYGETPLSERERPSYGHRKFSLSPVFQLKLNKIMLRFTLRNLRKNRLHSALNIAGLAIGLSACLTIAAYVYYEFSYDRHHPDAENTYRIALNRIYPEYNKEWAITAPILAPTITEELPEIENYTRVSWDDLMFGPAAEKMQKERITAVDSGFFQVFDTKILSGNISNDLFERKDKVILTESAAHRFFGDKDPVGETFHIQFPSEALKQSISVAAVISDPLPNSHFSYDIIGTFDMLQYPDFIMEGWGTFAVYSYIKVHPDTDTKQLIEKINAISVENLSKGDAGYAQWMEAGNAYDYFLQPLTDIHLNSNLAEELEANSNKTFVYFFALVGIFILLMAIVNFVNSATARASRRTLEVGIRKAVGAGRSDLMVQFLLESTVISIVALLISFPLALFFLPSFNQVVDKSITFDFFTSPPGIAALFVTPLFLGILSGFYPALYLSRFSPVAVFQRLWVKRGKENLRHLLVIGQLVIAVVLISCTITVFRQMHFLTSKPLGFDKDQLITISRLPFFGEKIETFKQEARKIPGVNNVSTSSFPMDDIRAGGAIRNKENKEGWINTILLSVDENYLSTTGIQLIAGRDFRPNEVEQSEEGIQKIILNKSAAKALGWSPDEAVDQPVYWSSGEDEYDLVIGVTEDFHFNSLHRPSEPLQFSGVKFVDPFRAATIRIDPRKTKEALAGLEELWNEFSPDQVFDYQFVDEAMAQYYEAERLTGNLFVIFSGLGIFICCLGLFGLMGYVVEQRAKEVGIRKVMGARVRQIILLLSRDYIRLVLISSVIAIPIAWWGLNQWLESFAFRIENSIWILLLGGILVTVISWITVAFYAFQAANSNPVDSLRNE